MTLAPILLIGGSGVVGRHAAQLLRAASHETPLLIAGRERAKAERIAAEVGNAQGVSIDLSAADLGLGGRAVSAVAVLLRDEAAAGLRFAQARGVPHVSIASGIDEIAPEVAAYMHAPQNAAVVLGTEWLVGATTIPTLEVAKRFSRIDDIAIGALLDEQDAGGPAQVADLASLVQGRPKALTRRDGVYFKRVGEAAKARFRAVDGTEVQAFGFSAFDVVALAAATGAPNVQFNLATGMSSSRRRGEPMSTEVVVEMAGADRAGRPLRSRHAVLHPAGQMPLTGLGVAMVLERLVGIDGAAPAAPGLYFPCQLLEPSAYLARLEAIGGTVSNLAS
jgi:hypothetical protein